MSKTRKEKYSIKAFLKDVKVTAVTIIVIAIICVIVGNIVNRYIPSRTAWTYLKYDNKLYVLCSPEILTQEQLKSIKLTKVGTVKREIFAFFKPRSNNVSNGFKKGTEIYSSDVGEVLIKFKGEFHSLEDTATADGWGNGIQVRLH